MARFVTACVARFLQAAHAIRTVQELRGHPDVSTPMMDTPVLKMGGSGVRSLFDLLP
jgi:hypothetical protein